MVSVLERLFEIPKFRLFLALWTCVSAAVLIYFANQNFKPDLSAPISLIANLNITRLTAEDCVRLRLKWPAVQADLKQVDSLFQVLGTRRQPVDVKISSRDPLMYRLSSNSIELGISYAVAPGQLAHAILQNWFLQNYPVRNLGDQLQQILFADVFWASAHGRFELGIPNTQLFLKLTQNDLDKAKLDDIAFHVASPEVFANSEWAPPEMRKGEGINPLSLRKYLLEQILKSELSLGFNSRIQFLKQLTNLNFSTYEEEKLKIQNLNALVNKTFSKFGIPSRLPKKAFSVDAFFDSPVRDTYTLSYLVRSSGAVVLYPGKILIDDLKQFKIRTLVVFSNINDIKQIENKSVLAQKILVIENPQEASFDSMKDFEKFARKNKTIRFAVFDQESLKFAAQKNLDQPLNELLAKNSKADFKIAAQTLGLDSATWDAPSQTYRATGAIEALQMWRPRIQ